MQSMNIFNRIVPWFIPTKEDQRKWYTEELAYNPKEISKLTQEFSEISREYNYKLGELEARLSNDFDLYKLYIEVKSLAQKVNFTWNRIETKNNRQIDLKEMLSKLNR